MIANVTNIVTKLDTKSFAKNDAIMSLSPRFRQVLIESPLQPVHTTRKPYQSRSGVAMDDVLRASPSPIINMAN
ncbi:hypothetical protein TNCV_4491541 [Trichonephila clavipes]|nr:hypothetical protein TNCV_4491541 [Trichonephila clavipes]